MIVSEFAKLFDSSEKPIVAVKDNSIVYFNPAAEICFSQLLPAPADTLFADTGSEITIDGKEYTFSACDAFEHRIYTLTPNFPDDELFMRMLSSKLKEHIASLRLSCSMIMPQIENIADDKTLSGFRIIAKTSAVLHRLAGNLGYLQSFDSKAFLPVTFDAAECLRDIADSVSAFVGQRCPLITFKCSEKSLLLQADKNQFELMIFQILSNSIKYTPADGSITITLAKNADKISIVVSDTGYGIPTAQLENIWEPGISVITPESGIGLGLPIVQHIAKLHGGFALITSDKNGTSITVSLPAAHPDSDKLNSLSAIYESGLSDLMLQLSDVIPSENFRSTFMD